MVVEVPWSSERGASVPTSNDGKPSGKKVGSPTVTPRRASSATSSNEQLRAGENVNPGLIGARLRARRLSRGISLRQFARDLEVSASFISQLETGKAQPSVATLFAICSAPDIATDDLFDSAVSNGNADLAAP